MYKQFGNIMRPHILFPLFSDISNLAGIGPKTKIAYDKLAGSKIIDLLFHFPVSVVDRRRMPEIFNMKDNEIVTSVVHIEEYIPPARPKDKNSPWKIRCYNETGFLTLVYFHAYPESLKRTMPVGVKRVVSGRVERFGGEIQIAHPDYVAPVEKIADVMRLDPVYPLAVGVTQKSLSKAIGGALQKVTDLPEWIDEAFLAKKKWGSWSKSIRRIHSPEEISDVASDSPFMTRLAYDELLANQLSLMLVRRHNRAKGLKIKGDGRLRKKFAESMPFELTDGQKDVIKEINADQESAYRMMRLLQGDVGSGKTVVAVMAILNAVEAGFQTALMVPTGILAKQHYESVTKSVENIGLKVELLVGSIKGKRREDILKRLKAGQIDILIGTHALFQEDVEFKNLGLAVIDEQHRFGVEQRLSLVQKGGRVDFLLMTATPIPRTLTMSMYGDMDCSRLTQKPFGRKDVDTRVVPASKMAMVIEGIGRTIDQGNKVYWICPLVEESEKSDLAAVEERFEHFKKIFGKHVAMVHGRMKADEREDIMEEFKNGEVDILIATTVVEVGVDVKDATVIVIEHAERFGLSQLHQLRGRVGRNDKQSSCILLYHGLGEIAKERLKIMRESNDGFRLAEEDLKLRGGGDVLGTKQSGTPAFRIANLFEHFDLFMVANDDAKLIINNDPQLDSKRGQALRVLLYLFEHDHNMKYLNG